MSASSPISLADSSAPGQKKKSVLEPLKNLFLNQTFYFFFYVVLCFATVIFHCGWTRGGATSFLWALACMSVGAAFGFLFGIPKIFQSNRTSESAATEAASYRQQVNTNLTEISDWLTKIIVGLGLINLGKIPGYLGNVAGILSGSINNNEPGAPHIAFAYGLIVCFPILGFLAAYLYTRLFLQGAFSRADQEAAQQQQNETDARVASLETRVDAQQDQIIEQRNPAVAPSGNGAHEQVPISFEHSDNIPKLEGMAGLRKLADEYMNVSSRDYHSRLRMKNDLGKKLFNYVLSQNISKDELLREIESSGNEGIALALAYYVLAMPEVGDMARILAIGFRISRWHVQYRIVQAVGQLFEKHCAVAKDREAALRLLLKYDLGGDSALKKLILGVRSLIERNLQVEESSNSAY